MINADWKWDSETGTFVVFNAADESFIGTAESRAEACEMVERLNNPPAPEKEIQRVGKLTPHDLNQLPDDLRELIKQDKPITFEFMIECAKNAGLRPR